MLEINSNRYRETCLHSQNGCVVYVWVIQIELVCQKWHGFYQELLIFKWWTGFVKIYILYAGTIRIALVWHILY